MKPGPTLADSSGLRRIAWLENIRLDIWQNILREQDNIACITHEIQQLKAAEAEKARLMQELLEKHGSRQ